MKLACYADISERKIVDNSAAFSDIKPNVTAPSGLLMTTITLDSQFVRNPDLIATDMDGDTVMMSIEHGKYYGVSGVGTRIWELLEKPTTPSQIIISICKEFEVDETTCRADVERFITELIDNGMVLAA